MVPMTKGLRLMRLQSPLTENSLLSTKVKAHSLLVWIRVQKGHQPEAHQKPLEARPNYGFCHAQQKPSHKQYTFVGFK